SRLYAVDGPVNLVRLTELIDLTEQPALRFEPFSAGMLPNTANLNIFEQLRRNDILLHHPFQSFQTVIDFICVAASDPQVVAIKQTIYRTGMNSDLMEALMTAARMGKEVTVIVELMARFDEEANINWADKLQQAGAQVVYGIVGLKTHAKMALVIRREAEGLQYYAHLGTGNYHLTTTRLYTDFGMLSANQAIGEDVNEVFIHLTSLTKPHKLNHLWLAPFALQNEIIKAIRNEAKIARAGRPGRIIAKFNALVDESVIRALYAASNDGVKIDLIVRGACTLRPGVAGMSDNIKVRSVIGRFLEHSRIFYFRNDLAHDVYLASADWMTRNLFRRIEVAFPVLDKTLKRRVITEGLNTYLKENANAWELEPDGNYRRRKVRGKQTEFSAQRHLMGLLGTSQDGLGT
ncbi:MAG: polyphosphate kinase 1, partial [Massilia sp.]|nr:polyphosphate kinase 1 [Massilia sp.]